MHNIGAVIRPRYVLLSVIPLALAACRIGYDELALGMFVGQGGGVSNGAANGAGTSSSAGQPTEATGGAGSEPIGAAGVGGADSNPDCQRTALVETPTPQPPPALACPTPGALACEGFEEGQQPYWRVWATPPSTGALQGCLVHSGNYALQATPNGTNVIQVQEPLASQVGSGSLFLRSFVYLPSEAVLPAWTVLFEVWDSPTSYTDKISLDLGADGSLGANNSSGSGQKVSYLSSGDLKLARDQWVCLELEIVVDKSNGSVRLFVDDVEAAATAAPTRTRGNRAFTTVSLGAVIESGSLDLYHDDFVAATERVGCL